jgi:ABC-type transporter Mla maintaining outer membrane lipid asymmetry ATPase subunit MlaF
MTPTIVPDPGRVPTGADALAISNLVKNYGGLRPLRVRRLVVGPGQIVSVRGFDPIQAEVMIGLATGAILPDEGEVVIFGEPTSILETSERWLASLDRIGLVSVRTVLVDALSVAQNIAVPLTLELDPLPEPVRGEVRRLAAEAGIDETSFDSKAGAVPPPVRARVHLARALAMKPRLLLLEHASAALAEGDAPVFGTSVSRVATRRGLSVLALTADPRFAKALGGRKMSWTAASGEVRGAGGWARWF